MKKIKYIFSLLLIIILLISSIDIYGTTTGEYNGGAQGPSNTLVHSESSYTFSNGANTRIRWVENYRTYVGKERGDYANITTKFIRVQTSSNII